MFTVTASKTDLMSIRSKLIGISATAPTLMTDLQKISDMLEASTVNWGAIIAALLALAAKIPAILPLILEIIAILFPPVPTP